VHDRSLPAPAWLLRDEAYAPRCDREAFLDRSSRSVLRLLAVLRRRAGGASGEARGLSRVDARVGLASMILFILLVSLSRGALFLACAGTGLLVLLSAQRAEAIREVLAAALAAAGFTAVIMLPSALAGNAFNAGFLTAKVTACAAAARLFAAVTEPRRVTRALAAFRVPDIVILVLDTALRSLSILGDLALQMLRAVKLRSVGRNPDKRRALAGIAGTLFLKAHRMTEETAAAMACRGFTGGYRAAPRGSLGLADALVLCADLAMAALFVLAGRG
jgi:cobalt/nickel transport system permease protein